MYCPFSYKNCSKKNQKIFADLGKLPRVDVLLSKNDLKKKEILKPLKTFFCKKCFLVQHPIYSNPMDIFVEDYIYYSSTVASWVNHCRDFVKQSIKRFSLSKKSFVIEVASNDGYLLQHYVKRNIPSLGIEPSKGVIKEAKKKGVKSLNDFYNFKLAKKIIKSYPKADLIIANNVLAHIPDLKDFIKSTFFLLKEDGVLSVEFPHILNLIKKKQFDTIYDEHYFYFSLTSITSVFNYYDLIIFDVEVIFLFPWAVIFQDLSANGFGLLAFIEMFIFVSILIVGFAYVWVKGDLDWVKTKLKYGEGRYADLNARGK